VQIFLLTVMMMMIMYLVFLSYFMMGKLKHRKTGQLQK